MWYSFLLICLLSCLIPFGQALNASDNADILLLVDGKAKDDVIEQEYINTTLKNPDDGKNFDESIDGNASMIDIRDEVSLDDEALVITHIDSDIADFESLKKSITFLEKSIRKHADTHVVNSQELVAANEVCRISMERL